MPEPYSHYDALEAMAQAVADGRHRAVIGGLWEELGALQREFLIAQGLKPHHRLIDVGCGSLRAGVPLTAYLDADRYYGIDISFDLLEAGYEREIRPAGLAAKLPRDHLHATAAFDLSAFGQMFDVGIAQSVFTHMPVSRLTDCLRALRPYFELGGRFFVTFFERPETAGPETPVAHQPGGVTTFSDQDPFDMTLPALRAATPDGWALDVIGDWGHPRNQQMACFTRKA